MPPNPFLRHAIALAALMLLSCTRSVDATEGASGMYLLGSQSLNAGLSPAPGWYFSLAAVQYSGSVAGSVQGGVSVAELKKRSDSLTGVLLYAPKRKLLGAQATFSLGVPYAYLRLGGEVGGAVTRQRSVSGSGKGDTSLGLRLGWQASPSFTQAVALTLWAPTGDYQKGFRPSIGRHRWAGDLIWAFTYAPGNHRTELSAAIGYGFNGPNTVTHYRSGNEAHLELGIGQRVTPHLEVGLASYFYRQVSADNGSGAFLGTLKGRVNGAGPALNYSRTLSEYGLALSARYYHEFDAKRHFEGNLAFASATLRF